MSAPERRKRRRKAFEKGAAAYREGKPIKMNPYVLSAWSVGREWEKGWLTAQDESRFPRTPRTG